MRKFFHKRFLYAIVLLILASVAGLWSWNTISELFNLPQAQYKHVVAAFFLLFVLRWGLSSGHRAVGRLGGEEHKYLGH
ncbi:MAG: hypothetical protein JSW10_11010 [Pseudomonadota bacterium]|nr:MAG: hypothetical protein JSW10_11010 [Pseudomonadota bacterium]